MAILQKRLEGIQVSANPALASLYDDCLKYCKSEEGRPLLTTISTDSEGGNHSPARTTTNNTTCTPSSHTVARLLRPLSREEAVAMLLDFDTNNSNKSNNTSNKRTLPISVLRAMQVVLQQQSTAENANKLDEALSPSTTASAKTKLAFTPPATLTEEDEKNNKQFQARMARLRLQHEATQYQKLTHNIDGQYRHQHEDDVTTKSMTYAASVGLNMIVAPLSFGVFMYFFSGPLLNVAFTEFVPTHPGAVDVRKVMIGVISGVGMLFVEMMLFVIRTHEFEQGLRRKNKKQGKNAVKPFGEYSSQSDKTYTSKSGFVDGNMGGPAIVAPKEPAIMTTKSKNVKKKKAH